MSRGIIKSFEKVATGLEQGSAMGRFAQSALNAFGGATPKAIKAPIPPSPPKNVGQTINNKIGNPFG